ncbi:CBS domain-containing protein [Zhouia amylolytica]|uniref:CBS domain-containing protein n=1 Tax=Zhouia amylolytica TaxID=376730 RepID=UPI0020CCFDA3|nr:CBS domain-containing protein [Zhouia amylolytica]MCQ0111194.1 CBS domain-containing protein [Zhouia amylolytica]
MGEHVVKKLLSADDRMIYTHQLLNDIAALEKMYQEDLFEKGVMRIGAEQELCLINKRWYPSATAIELLKALNDEHYTTELALYNLEVNLDPLELTGDCFSVMKKRLHYFLEKISRVADKMDLKIILTGILPTIDTRFLTQDYMTPELRYMAINESFRALRRDDFKMHIKGVDEVDIMHKTTLFEGCNTSFQLHLQVEASDFVNRYNWAQAIAGPVMAICVNSPLLLGKELWDETRIALFAQSVDTRATSFKLNEREARVSFGEGWVKGNAVDLFKQDVVRYRSILSTDFKSNSLQELEHGKIPKLKALGLHNGTIYRWNRACYGVTNGKPHLRIENRYIPSGPSVTDEIANMLFWVGLMVGQPKRYEAIDELMDFKDVKNNFICAARYGMGSQMYWEGRFIPTDELISQVLIPMAGKGLEMMKVDKKDIDFYLNVIDRRTQTHTGARWIRNTYRRLLVDYKRVDATRDLVRSLYENQVRDIPVCDWKEVVSDRTLYLEEDKRVYQYMNRNVVTVHVKDNAKLVGKLMLWRNIHHMPVIDDTGELKGLITWTDIDAIKHEEVEVPIEKHMKTAIITIGPSDLMHEAKQLMEDREIGCLPVVEDDTLVGIITRNDIKDINN